MLPCQNDSVAPLMRSCFDRKSMTHCYVDGDTDIDGDILHVECNLLILVFLISDRRIIIWYKEVLLVMASHHSQEIQYHGR